MHCRHTAIVGVLAAVALSSGACTRNAADSPNANAEVSRDTKRAGDLTRERTEEIDRLDQRVADIERKYAAEGQKVGSRAATAAVREELQEDVNNVKQAVNGLRSTTPDNWWDRHEAAITRTTDDIESDVRRLAGGVTPQRRPDTTGTTGEGVSTAPFSSRRDKLVATLRARVDAMQNALDKVKASGARETELDDTRARVRKLADDIDRLRSASADDWWDVSKARVTDYVDRVEESVDRLDDNRN
jgi:hypothetical protein